MLPDACHLNSNDTPPSKLVYKARAWNTKILYSWKPSLVCPVPRQTWKIGWEADSSLVKPIFCIKSLENSSCHELSLMPGTMAQIMRLPEWIWNEKATARHWLDHATCFPNNSHTLKYFKLQSTRNRCTESQHLQVVNLKVRYSCNILFWQSRATCCAYMQSKDVHCIGVLCLVGRSEQHNGPNTKAERWTLTWCLCLYHMTFCLYLWYLHYMELDFPFFHYFTIYDINNRYVEGLKPVSLEFAVSISLRQRIQVLGQFFKGSISRFPFITLTWQRVHSTLSKVLKCSHRQCINSLSCPTWLLCTVRAFEKVTQQRRACSLGSALGKEITLGTGLRPPDLLEVLIKSRIFMAPRSEIRPHLASHTVD